VIGIIEDSEFGENVLKLIVVGRIGCIVIDGD
jgi:hypothetical protein